MSLCTQICPNLVKSFGIFGFFGFFQCFFTFFWGARPEPEFWVHLKGPIQRGTAGKEFRQSFFKQAGPIMKYSRIFVFSFFTMDSCIFTTKTCFHKTHQFRGLRGPPGPRFRGPPRARFLGSLGRDSFRGACMEA